MSFTYVIPDIHGRCDLLERALAEIARHSGGEAGIIVSIGDYVDKGPQSRQVIERLLPGIAGGWTFVALKGNHDAMMVRGAARSREAGRVAGEGRRCGAGVLWRRSRRRAASPHRMARPIAADACRRASSLRSCRRRSRSAAGPAERSDAVVEALSEGISGGFGDRHVVHGHDNDPDGPLLYEGRTNLDTRRLANRAADGRGFRR